MVGPARLRTAHRLALAAAAVFLSGWLFLSAVRDWLALGMPLETPFGVPGSRSLLIHNHLQGWFYAGTLPLTMRWNGASLRAAALWEWLPSLLFMCGLAALVAGLLAARRERRGGRRSPPRRPGRLARHAWLLPTLVALAMVAVAAAFSTLAFERTPHVQDSIAQLFQARVFATGRVWAPVPAAVDFVGMEFLVADHGRWYSQYPPGHSALLALGVLAGAPWLVNPILGGLAVLVTFGAALRAYGRRVAVVTTLLLGLSPFVWFMSAEFMNHASTMLLGAAALWAAAAAPPGDEPRLRAASVRMAALAGLFVALALTVRPLTALGFALPLSAYFLTLPARAGTRWLRLAALGSACAAGALSLCGYNLLTTGHPLQFGYEIQWGQSGMGFGSSQWGPPHSPQLGLTHLLRNLGALSKYLLEWPFPCFVPLAGLFWLRTRLTRYDALLGGWVLSLAGVHFFYFYQDLCFGPRFLYCATPAALMLIARGLQGLGIAFARKAEIPARQGQRVVWRLALFCSGAGLAMSLPVLWTWYSDSFWSVEPGFARRLERQLPPDSVVCIRDANRARESRLMSLGVSRRVAHSATTWLDEAWIDRQYMDSLRRHAGRPDAAGRELETTFGRAAIRAAPAPRRRHAPWVDYSGPTSSFTEAMLANTLDPGRQRVIYALDLGPRNAELLAHYPGRSVFLYAWDPAAEEFRLTRMELASPVSRHPPLHAQASPGRR